MPRTIIEIPDTQLRDLDARCNTLGISRAEAIRRAIDELLRDQKQPARDAYGLWGRVAMAREGRKQLKRRW